MQSLLPQNTWMSRSPAPDGLPRQLSGLGSGLAYFVDQDGNRIDEIECGQPFDFRVDGFTRVWLIQTKNGATNYDGMFDVPMGYYTPSCLTEPGLYHGQVFDPFVGVLLAEYDFEITGSVVNAIPGGTTTLLVAGGALLFLMMRKKGK